LRLASKISINPAGFITIDHSSGAFLTFDFHKKRYIINFGYAV
jgi:hypothetical protein